MNESTSGDKTATSGADEIQGESKNASKGANGYPAEFVEKLKKEKENLAKALTGMREEFSNLQKTLQTREQQELEQKQEYKKLYESERQRVEILNKEHQALQEQIKQAKVNTAIRSELMKLGLDENHLETALKLIDRNVVNVDPGTQVVVGADEAAKQFHLKHAQLGFFKRPTPGINQTASKAVEPGGMDLTKLSQSDKIKLLAKQRMGR